LLSYFNYLLSYLCFTLISCCPICLLLQLISIVFSRFVYVPCPHTAEVICDALLKCLQSWNLDCRVSTVTLDNCSVNDSMIGLMESRLGEGNMLLCGKHLHTRCCAHILNLIVQDGLEVIKKSIARIREGIALLDCYTKDV